MNMRTQFLVTFLGSLLVIICSMIAIFWLLLFAINGQASSPIELYKSVTQQKKITYEEQEALVTFRQIAKKNPEELMNPNIQQSIHTYEMKDLSIVIRKRDDIFYHSPDLAVQSLIVHAPVFDTKNIYTQGTIDNKGRLYRYLKFDFRYSDHENGSVMILKKESSFVEFLQRRGFIIVALIVVIATILVMLFNRSLNKTVIIPLRELSIKVQQLKSGKLDKEELSAHLLRELFNNNHLPVRQVLRLFDKNVGLPKGTGLFLFRYLIAKKEFRVNMNQTIDLSETVKNLSLMEMGEHEWN